MMPEITGRTIPVPDTSVALGTRPNYLLVYAVLILIRDPLVELGTRARSNDTIALTRTITMYK
jgi:hypothetical protein